MRLLSALGIGLLLTGSVHAETKFATWNLGAAWDGAIESRVEAFQAAAAQVAADVYVVEEITSLEGAETIANALGFTAPHIAVSNFAVLADQRDSEGAANAFFFLEVGVISRLPIISAQELEFDDRDRDGPIVNETTIPVSRAALVVPSQVADHLSGATKNALRFGRGVLRVELEGDIVIYAVHAKSDFNSFCATLGTTAKLMKEIEKKSDDESGLPQADIQSVTDAIAVLAKLQTAEETASYSKEWPKNAEKREAMFAAVVDRVKSDVAAGKTAMVMGDFNIALNDPRSGDDFASECNPTRMCSSPIADSLCSGKDGLDESHFILAGGLQDGIQMTPLTDELTETLTGPFASAIDHIYVAGPKAGRFSKALAVQDDQGLGFGSDHRPVVVTLSD